MLVIPQTLLYTIYFFCTTEGNWTGGPHPPVIFVEPLVCLKYIKQMNMMKKTIYNQNVLNIFITLYTYSFILL